jgi:hypothetical protein
MSNQNKIKRKLTQLDAIHHNVNMLQYKSFKQLTKELKVDSRLITYLHKNSILQKNNNVVVWNNSIKPNPALASTYQNYIDVINAKQKGRKSASLKLSKEAIGPVAKRQFSLFWGLINFKY